MEFREAVIRAANIRLSRLRQAESISAGLTFKPKRRENAPDLPALPVRKQIRPAPFDFRLPLEQQYVLAEETYQHILSVMQNMALVMEYSPKAFADLGQEALRFHFLVQLNGQYDETATGETFNGEGKSAHREMQLGSWPLDRPRPGDTMIAEAARLIDGARFPVVIAGGGVLNSGAGNALLRFAEKAATPVATTNMGKGAIPETHPLAMGVIGNLTGPGGLGRYTKPLVQPADVVLLIGNRTNEDGTDHWSLIPDDARVLHIDIDPQEIGRNYEAMRLVGDARATLEALTDALGGHSRDRDAIERCVADAWATFERERAPFLADAEPIRAERVLAAIQKRLGAQTIVVSDASYASSWVAGQLRITHSTTRVISPRGLAGLGWGLPLALGAKLARPAGEVIVVVGDGGFAHAWAELETAVRSGIRVTVVVLNNGVLGYQKDAEKAKFGRYTAAAHLGHVDHAAIARACGGHGETVERASHLDAAFDRAARSDVIALLDVLTDAGGHPPISLYDGTLDRLEHGRVVQDPVP
ncbi:thiamine pyrophosphate-dependent acetolactate synthase large subunit-like protein [Bradyrhizobium sp. S3.2.6]|uniref:thiamine pyrophosphate-dependent enzyme n=1 Tax=Bradyrhizobium sp. S3.2.6 TaxID=3156428 RepID=UPI00339936FB